jgi:hypothetical protein
MDYVTVEEMALMHNVAPNTIFRILRADQDKPESKRRIPGAVKEGSKYRGEWKIPRDVAEKWERSAAGRKSRE